MPEMIHQRDGVFDKIVHATLCVDFHCGVRAAEATLVGCYRAVFLRQCKHGFFPPGCRRKVAMNKQYGNAVVRAGEKDPGSQSTGRYDLCPDSFQRCDSHARGPHSTIAPPQM